MSAGRSWHWTVTATVHNDDQTTLTLSVTTSEKDAELAKQEFRSVAADLGHDDLTIEGVSLEGRR